MQVANSWPDLLDRLNSNFARLRDLPSIDGAIKLISKKDRTFQSEIQHASGIVTAHNTKVLGDRTVKKFTSSTLQHGADLPIY